MDKKVILLIFLASGINISAVTREPDEMIEWESQCGFLPATSVDAVVKNDDTVVTTFNEDMNNVTVTVYDQNGMVVYQQTFDALQSESCCVEINGYAPGQYSLEVSSDEGSLSGEFYKN